MSVFYLDVMSSVFSISRVIDPCPHNAERTELFSRDRYVCFSTHQKNVYCPPGKSFPDSGHKTIDEYAPHPDSMVRSSSSSSILLLRRGRRVTMELFMRLSFFHCRRRPEDLVRHDDGAATVFVCSARVWNRNCGDHRP